MSRRGKIFVLSGPSGSGKTTLHNALLCDKKTRKSLIKTISATTRLPRAGEKNKVHYLFFSKKLFQSRIKKGYFLEWQKVFNDYYGTPKAQAKRVLRAGRSVLLCIDVKGAKVVFDLFPDAVGIFVKAPSLDALRKRLQGRGTEGKKVIAHRLAVARKELKEAKRYRYVIVNDQIKKAVKELKSIVEQELSKTT
ncbi:MAG TPA: guanylate kinase [Candidatus Omnitrophota bacterium]|nr:guanylate kinase [Candidatus Omnitrophota bacterium]HQL41588.1 guanylate kinase [Candidatus Omnitrophota bacterium]